LGYDNRHDTLTLRTPDRNANLLILGREIRKPFYQRQSLEIGAEKLQVPVDGDDRIALLRDTGRVDVLARLQRRTDPAGIILSEESDQLSLLVAAPGVADAGDVGDQGVAGSAACGDEGHLDALKR
jgi:hypothetical protein